MYDWGTSHLLQWPDGQSGVTSLGLIGNLCTVKELQRNVVAFAGPEISPKSLRRAVGFTRGIMTAKSQFLQTC